jgi:hypothetical protein
MRSFPSIPLSLSSARIHHALLAAGCNHIPLDSSDMRSLKLILLSSSLWFALVGGACAAPSAGTQQPASPNAVSVPPQIVSRTSEGSARELMDKGERALLAQRWRDAADAFETLLAAEPADPRTEDALYGLATAYEGLELREKARGAYDALVGRFPASPRARAALARQAQIVAYLEDWPALAKVGDALLARKDADDVDRLLGLGARGLSKVEAGDDAGANHDVQVGLELAEGMKYGTTGRLPVPAAQLRFALGEIRRVRSERVVFLPVTSDFLAKINARCAGLMEAQSAYADAIRSTDPHWAAMSGYRIAEMYRQLHRDLMNIPPQNAKTEKDRQLFYGMMHMRYRVFVEKGIEMLRRTLTIFEAGQDNSSWIKRAEKAKAEMEAALEEEKARVRQFPFTEEELARALEMMQKKSEAKAPPTTK